MYSCKVSTNSWWITDWLSFIVVICIWQKGQKTFISKLTLVEQTMEMMGVKSDYMIVWLDNCTFFLVWFSLNIRRVMYWLPTSSNVQSITVTFKHWLIFLWLSAFLWNLYFSQKTTMHVADRHDTTQVILIISRKF